MGNGSASRGAGRLASAQPAGWPRNCTGISIAHKLVVSCPGQFFRELLPVLPKI
jgi:hypothetical protein